MKREAEGTLFESKKGRAEGYARRMAEGTREGPRA